MFWKKFKLSIAAKQVFYWVLSHLGSTLNIDEYYRLEESLTAFGLLDE